MIPFGILLATSTLGLLIGVAVKVLGTAAAIGLIFYFSCALSAHIRGARPPDRSCGLVVSSVSSWPYGEGHSAAQAARSAFITATSSCSPPS